MLFRKDIEKRCAYCARSVPTEEGVVMCVKRGIRKETDSCRKFEYDPLKRFPPRKASLKLRCYAQDEFDLASYDLDDTP